MLLPNLVIRWIHHPLKFLARVHDSLPDSQFATQDLWPVSRDRW